MRNVVTKYFVERQEWRAWLEANFDQKDEIWLEYPKKKSGKARILYNDAVEEALCFGWIDSTVRSLDDDTTIQRFCKRRARSTYSQANKERLKWLSENGLIHESIKGTIEKVLADVFVFPADILDTLK